MVRGCSGPRARACGCCGAQPAADGCGCWGKDGWGFGWGKYVGWDGTKFGKPEIGVPPIGKPGGLPGAGQPAPQRGGAAPIHRTVPRNALSPSSASLRMEGSSWPAGAGDGMDRNLQPACTGRASVSTGFQASRPWASGPDHSRGPELEKEQSPRGGQTAQVTKSGARNYNQAPCLASEVREFCSVPLRGRGREGRSRDTPTSLTLAGLTECGGTLETCRHIRHVGNVPPHAVSASYGSQVRGPGASNSAPSADTAPGR
jgi:hypothetical protein